MRNFLNHLLIGPMLRHVWVGALLIRLIGGAFPALGETTLLNASFDVSRQLFDEINPAFVQEWRKQTGETIIINQSHAGSSKQARAVVDGLAADVVTLNQSSDIDYIAQQRNLIPENWRTLLPNHSAPYTSTIAFVVRKDNPKHIKDWDDLTRPGVEVIIPNPKTSGNGRYSYLGAYAFALDKSGGSEAKAREFVAALFRNVPVLDSGGRAATTTFTQRAVGDVLLTFEAEALATMQEIGDKKFEVIVPPQSMEAEMPVAIVEKNVRKHGTEKAASVYLNFLYTGQAQEIIARNYYRPRSSEAFAKYSSQFGKVKLVTVDEVFGGWAKAQKVHFADGGIYDQIFQPKK
jgi:sulfate/thiosulfate-binding protein